MVLYLKVSILLGCVAAFSNGQQIVNGQIYTPGIAIVNSPQPNSPVGGDYLQIALDVTSNGQLPLPPYPSNPTSAIYNITIFLSSYTTNKNFTISNGTSTANNASLGNIMAMEASSTVKHINWNWPDCLSSSARGVYNISIRQNFRLNGTNRYTIFDLPIQVTNSIPTLGNRSSCDALNNPLLDQATLVASADNFTRIAGTGIQGGGSSSGSSSGIAGGFYSRADHTMVWILEFVVMFLSYQGL